jgi:hypothetical protein
MVVMAKAKRATTVMACQNWKRVIPAIFFAVGKIDLVPNIEIGQTSS